MGESRTCLPTGGSHSSPSAREADIPWPTVSWCTGEKNHFDAVGGEARRLANMCIVYIFFVEEQG